MLYCNSKWSMPNIVCVVVSLNSAPDSIKEKQHKRNVLTYVTPLSKPTRNARALKVSIYVPAPAAIEAGVRSFTFVNI